MSTSTSSSAARLLAAGIGIACAGIAVGDQIQTSFEFFDNTGSFTIGTDPSATFENGIAQSVGQRMLYTDGFNSWMIPAGNTGVITFDPPASSVEFDIRDQFASNNGSVQVFDPNGNPILGLPIGVDTTFQRLSFTGDGSPKNPLIGSIEITSNGSSGFTVIDLFVSCVGDDGGGPLEDPIPENIPMGDVEISLAPIATELTAPNFGTNAPGLTDHLFVTDQDGIIWSVDLTDGSKSVFLDAGDDLVELGAFGPGSFDERGLLGLAFHPDYATPDTPGFGLFYTYESHPDNAEPDFSTMPQGVAPDHQTVIVERRASSPLDPDAPANPTSTREILRIDQPQFNHNAGAMNFGPDDGQLYIALGDGGSADDQGAGHVAEGNGQDPTNILGSVLRIDPLGTNGVNGQYGVPSDNPFVGDPSALDEIFAFGFRNPFRFNFDAVTGDLWLGDVGQNDIEEVDVVTAGGNYGWRVKEGTFLFDPNGNQAGFVFENSPGDPPDMIDPVAQYDQDDGVSVIGGFVYRGSRIPQLAGRYVFGEFGPTFSNDGRVFYLDDRSNILEFQMQDPASLDIAVLGMGQDADGNLYVLGNSPDNAGAPFGDTGVVLRIDPACPADLTGPGGDGLPDGSLTADDFFFYLGLFADGDLGADLTGPGGDGEPDGSITADDFFFYLGLFADGCP